MHNDVDTIETAFEEGLIGPEFQRIRHNTCRVREHAVLGNDGITFDTMRMEHNSTFRKSL